MKPRSLMMMSALAAAMLAVPAYADSYKFTLHNNSKYPVTGFQTFEDGEWSTWSNVNVPPGDEQVMDWKSNEGSCTVPFRIMYKDIETEQYSVNWCKISHIRVSNDEVTAD